MITYMLEAKSAFGTIVSRLRMCGASLAHSSLGLLQALTALQLSIQLQGTYRRCCSRGEEVVILVANLIANVLIALRCSFTHVLFCDASIAYVFLRR